MVEFSLDGKKRIPYSTGFCANFRSSARKDNRRKYNLNAATIHEFEGEFRKLLRQFSDKFHFVWSRQSRKTRSAQLGAMSVGHGGDRTKCT
jgi:hypothetical protein